MSVPELFHHQHMFFGCLTVQRRPRTPPGVPGHAASEELASRLWHRVSATDVDTDDVLLATSAFDLELSQRCPALDDEQRCSLQGERKPAICRVVPLDALRPDSAQHDVLAGRAVEARYLGSECIVPGERAGFEVVTRRLNVVDAGARDALSQRRRDLEAERSLWGDTVFGMLRADLFESPVALARVPANGFMTLSIAPVLMALIRETPASRGRCVAYLEAQSSLAERMLRAVPEVNHAAHPPLRQLALFARTNARLHAQLKDS